eukprot:scaffold736_cov254-Pinguiococcus_pyrenoidosus.AAC.33
MKIKIGRLQRIVLELPKGRPERTGVPAVTTVLCTQYSVLAPFYSDDENQYRATGPAFSPFRTSGGSCAAAPLAFSPLLFRAAADSCFCLPCVGMWDVDVEGYGCC